jgi:F0F1-type ATP synthase membrane subunit b/b'
MTPVQIKNLLDRTHEAVTRISAELDDAENLDGPVQDLSRRAAQIVGELRTLGEKIRARADAQAEAADTADSIADELDAIADQLGEFEG